MSAPVRLRCAIYTRKSTEEGLEQEFNSLDAQREACAAFIASQAGLGWKLVPDRYDDGGISGGTMERPALQRLLQDIRGRKVDVVVVYKIDRLTRSLTDFARIVEVFDAASASFVSVTQQFNTTTSMGRLTLNVLLSFAQFEREVTAERIRDKIAASKAKGMWMGGTVPFGYRVEQRKLIVDEAAAAEVRVLFDRYLELGSVAALARELNRQSAADDSGSRSLLSAFTGQGRRRPAPKVGYGKLYYMLSNPIYVGRVKHRDRTYEGEHEPIIAADVFSTVQARLGEQAPRERGTPVQRDIHLLNGLLFDETADRLSPIHANKAGKRYRYYISSRLKESNADTSDGWRLPAKEIEEIVIWRLKTLFADTAMLSSLMQEAGHLDGIEAGLNKAAQSVEALADRSSPGGLRDIIHVVLRRIDLASERVRLTIDTRAVTRWLAGFPAPEGGNAADNTHPAATTHFIDLPLIIRRRGVERRLVIEGEGASHQHIDQPLIETIARAHAYVEALVAGQSRADIASRFNVHPEDVSRLLPLAFLAPDIATAILTGQQPANLSARDLTRRFDLPIEWAAQRQVLSV